MVDGLLHTRWAFLLVSITIVASGCFVSQRSPDPPWVAGTDRAYPPSRYLLGVGQGDSKAEATDDAYAAVARVFQARISAESFDRETWQRTEGPRSDTEHLEKTLEQRIRISTDKGLRHVQVLETWSDSAREVHYALAGINRVQAETALLEEIAEQDRLIEALVQHSRASTSPLDRTRYLRRALHTLLVRTAYNDDLRVIRTSGHGIPSPHNAATLRDELRHALTRISVAVHVEGMQGEAARHAIIKGLIKEGLHVAIDGEGESVSDAARAPGASAARRGPDLVISGTVRLRQVDLPDPTFTFVRWCSDFLVKEADSQIVVGASSASGREGHLTEREALKRAVDAMQQALTTRIATTMAAYLSGAPSASSDEPSDACAHRK